MKNKIKTIVAAVALTVSLGASALTNNEGFGIGVIAWHNSACEAMSDRGFEDLQSFLSDNDITPENIESTPGLYDGYDWAEDESDCSSTQGFLIYTEQYHYFQ